MQGGRAPLHPANLSVLSEIADNPSETSGRRGLKPVQRRWREQGGGRSARHQDPPLGILAETWSLQGASVALRCVGSHATMPIRGCALGCGLGRVGVG